MEHTTDISMTNELLGALAMGSLSSDDLNSFEASPRDFLDSKFSNGVNSDIAINVVGNSSKEVNIALPYYSNIEKIRAELLTPEQLSESSGGEIVIAAIITATAIGVTAVAVGVTGFAVDYTIKDQNQYQATGVGMSAGEYGTSLQPGNK